MEQLYCMGAMKIEILLNDEEAKAVAEYMRKKYERVWTTPKTEENLATYWVYDQISEFLRKIKK